MPEAHLNVDTVRWLLAHMDDSVALAENPALADTPGLEAPGPYGRGNAIRTLLLECIERLRPSRRGSYRPDDSRSYNALWLRYVEGMSVLQVGEELALSERQTYRELRAAEAKLTEVLGARLEEMAAVTPPDGPAGDEESLDIAARLAQVDLQALLREATATVAPLAEGVGVRMLVESEPADGTVFTDAGILRQWVIQALSLGIQAAAGGEVLLSALRSGVEVGVSIRFAAPLPPHSREALDGLEHLADALDAGFRVEDPNDGPARLTIALPQREARTILVIEDSPAAVELYRRYLQPQGEWHVMAADDPRLAFDMARDAQPSIILLDLLMPGTDGWTILNLLHANQDTRGIPVIVCSVFHDALLAEALGAKAHLRKPVSQAELLAAVRRWAR